MGLRIVLVSREYPPDTGGGIGAYAQRMVPALVHSGATVSVITRTLNTAEREAEHLSGVTVHRVEMGDRSGESCLRASIVVAQQLLDLVRSEHIDAIEFAEYEAMASAWLALRSLDRKAAKVPVALHLHSPTELNAKLNGHDPASLDRAMRDLIEAERRCLALADGVCAPGSFMADWAAAHFGLADRPTVIPYAADPGDPPQRDADTKTLLYVGRLEQRKGVDTLIRAWNRVAPTHADWTLGLIGADTSTAPGGGSCRDWLESLLDPSLHNRTEFCGPLAGDPLGRARCGAAIAVIPSQWENFPNTCIEAMASGLPVVASDHGGMAEMLGLPTCSGRADKECGSVFPAGDDHALADALHRWMSMPPVHRTDAGSSARTRIGTLCDPEAVAPKRLEWLGSLEANACDMDPTLAELLRADDLDRTSPMDQALQRTLDRFDLATGAADRSGDPARWIERMRSVLHDLASRDLSPVALYGAGHFTSSIGPALIDPPGKIACIIDDSPAQNARTMHGLPIVSQQEARDLGVRAVVLSVNQWEDTLWTAAAPLRRGGIEVVRLYGRRPRVLIVSSGSTADHFEGVAGHLRQLGLDVIEDDGQAVYPIPDDGTDLVCVADVLAPRNIAVLRAARRKEIRTLLMMDGIVEWRNTFINALAGPKFLRPAPVDFVCCATHEDEEHLRNFGNDAKVAGLPRLDGIQQVAFDKNGPLLVATANTPWFNEAEQSRLMASLQDLKRTLEERGIPVRWRLTGGLDRMLGVESQDGPLSEAMSGCRGVISAPSTLLLEAALVGQPVAILDPFDSPALEGMAEIVRSANAEVLLDSLAQCPTWLDRAYPPMRSGEPAARMVARQIASITRSSEQTPNMTPLLNAFRLPEEMPRTERPRAVSVIVCDGSPTSGVTTFSLRMSAESAARTNGWEWRTLLVQTKPKNIANDGLRELQPDSLDHVHVCVLDPTADHHEILAHCREAIERLHPDVLVPNFSDMAWAIAAQLRHRGVRTLGIMHSDDDAYRSTLHDRPIWDAGVAVSATCEQQMKSIAEEVFSNVPPIEAITYGVPVAAEFPPRSSHGPIRLVYVGRLIEHQKRVSRLIDLAEHLVQIGCDFRLDLIGDGPSEGHLRSQISSRRLDELVRLRGRLTPDQVQQQLARADALVLTSDFEGTSVAMLEAMGQGALPCVSRVASGVDEWITDGQNGLTAPVGDVAALARRINLISNDRDHLQRMQRAAWETVRSRSSTGVMFGRYQQVLDVMMHRPLTPTRDTLGLYLTEGGRWCKPWCDDPEGAKAYAERVLEEAGYANIADGDPQPGCDAVLADVLASPEAVCRADEWRQSGLAVAYLPCIIRPGWVRFGGVLRKVAESGAQRIVLYGAGQHTRRVLPVLRGHLPIVGIIDDHAAGQSICGLPVVAPSDAMTSLKPDAIVLSSDSIEEKLWQASRRFREAGLPVHTVYGDYADPPQRSELATA